MLGLFSWSPHTLHMRHSMTKPTKWPLRPANTQISVCIRPAWSESSLSVWRNLGSLATHWVHNEDSDQTVRMPRLIWVFAGRTYHFVGFVVLWLTCFSPMFLTEHRAVSQCYHLAGPYPMPCYTGFNDFNEAGLKLYFRTVLLPAFPIFK